MRTHTAMVRLTDAEWSAWNDAARSAGYGRTATWVREVVAAHIAGATKNTSATDGVDSRRELAAQIARVGSNLNQISRALNIEAAGGKAAPGAEELVELLLSIHGQLRTIRDGAES